MKRTLLILAASVVFVPVFAFASGPVVIPEESAVVSGYVQLVSGSYTNAYEDAVKLQAAISAFLDNPGEGTLSAAKSAWLVSRLSYGRTEAFRFYEGPIDSVGADGEEGPEGRLNAWPLDEAYIDYVEDDKAAGLVNNSEIVISKEALSGKNQEHNEADVATGYHAIEFLLWGQDLSLDGPGARPVSDYAKIPANERRRLYLKIVTELLVEDLAFLVEAWAPEKDNFARSFTDDPQALVKILVGLTTLSGFELASERMATALDSGDQEDEHSCFSDNTHNDFISNAQGIYDVYFGLKDGQATGVSLNELVKAKDAVLADKIEKNMTNTLDILKALPAPIDREILASPSGSAGRIKMEEAIASLQAQADLFKQAGAALGHKISMSE